MVWETGRVAGEKQFGVFTASQGRLGHSLSSPCFEKDFLAGSGKL